jgi:hypothetical protein
MDPNPTLQEFHTHLAVSTPLNVDAAIIELEAFYSDILHIFQKDVEFFSKERTLFGINLSEHTAEKDETFWKHFQMCLFSSFFHGDMKQKIGTLIQTAKNLWSASGQSNDEVDRILNDEHTEDRLQDLYEYVTNLRTAKVCMSLLEEIDVDALGLSLENPAELFDMVRNPEHPTMKKCITAVQKQLQHKLQRGELSQNQLQADIEGLKVKVQSLFGNVLNESLLGGRRADVPSSVIMSNSPEARRQRMLARLQRKQREKTQ